MFGEKEWKHLQSIYTQILADVQEGKNLDQHIKDVNVAINDMEKLILAERSKGIQTTILDEVKNDFFYLKYLILEKTLS